VFLTANQKRADIREIPLFKSDRVININYIVQLELVICQISCKTVNSLVANFDAVALAQNVQDSSHRVIECLGGIPMKTMSHEFILQFYYQLN
jgi:hypothetical protein